jgi:hypothetical protein
MEEILLNGWSISTFVVIALGLFAKYCPQNAILKKIEKPLFGFGVAISKFLILRLGKESARKVEEGLISTLLIVIGKAPLYILEGLLSDNKKVGSNGKKNNATNNRSK